MAESSRRNFFRGAGKGAGLLGAFFAGVSAPAIAETVKQKVDPSVVAKIEEQSCHGNISLIRTYGEIAPKTDSPYTFDIGPNFVPGTEKTMKVHLAPGPDGELYLKINDEWKRVLTT
jgi:hypothetical protein